MAINLKILYLKQAPSTNDWEINQVSNPRYVIQSAGTTSGRNWVVFPFVFSRSTT